MSTERQLKVDVENVEVGGVKKKGSTSLTQGERTLVISLTTGVKARFRPINNEIQI